MIEVIAVKNFNSKLYLAAVALLLTVVSPAYAQYGEGEAAAPSSSSGSTGSTEFSSYVDVLFNYEKSETEPRSRTTQSSGGILGGLGGSTTTTVDDPIGTAKGMSVVAGFRRKGWYGFEFGGSYTKGGDVAKQSLIFNTLIYPFENNFYLKLASGVTRYVEYPIERTNDPIPDGDDDFITLNYGAGLGYVIPFDIGDTSLGIRLEAVYLAGDRFLERESDFEEDIRAPGILKDIQINIGLRFPL
jgi:hypothetical protein|tara:strand:+ start:16062 stop:16793 length:732 start_codon:yes stop_codon:yes gene_type:complete